MLIKKTYNKPALSSNQQIELLISRGLTISNRTKAEHHLKFIGYYRLSGYMIPFYSRKNYFMPGVRFEQILDLYSFDRDLRMLIFDAIEVIEVAMRAVLTNTLSLKHDPHWFTDKNLFEVDEKYEETIDIIKKSTVASKIMLRDSFISHYYQSYKSPELPPSWMTLETLSIGTLSVIFKSLKRDLRKLISTQFQLDETILSSWLHSLTYTRNLVAHHSRVWNRTFTIKPKTLKRHKNFLPNDACVFAQYVLINYMLKIISPNYNLKKIFIELFMKYPLINITRMGFLHNWQNIDIS